MKYKYTNEVICKCCLAYRRGKPVEELMKEYEVPRSTLYSWFKKFKDLPQNDPENCLNVMMHRSVEKRQQEKLKAMCEILQKAECTASAPLRDKLYALEKLYGEYKTQDLCDALQVDRGTFLNHVLRSKKDQAYPIVRRNKMKEVITRIYNESGGIYGSAKIHAVMRAEGHTISIKFVEKLMQEMQLKSLRDLTKKQFMRDNRVRKKRCYSKKFYRHSPE